MSFSKIFCARTVRDHNKLSKRMEDNIKVFDQVSKVLLDICGLKQFGSKCAKLAILMSEELKLPIDRLSKRVKNASICWFCENWREVSPHLPVTFDLNKCHQGRNCTVSDPEENFGKSHSFFVNDSVDAERHTKPLPKTDVVAELSQDFDFFDDTELIFDPNQDDILF